MVKKEFTDKHTKELNEKSDVELIEILRKPLSPPSEINTIKAILDARTKRSIQYLAEVIQESSRITEKYNKRLVTLTWVIVILTILMLLGLGIQIWLNLK